jgi:divinyl protochlorophyllide a 8-vinyl-reductase
MTSTAAEAAGVGTISRIGPNAITQVIDAARNLEQVSKVRSLLRSADLERYLDAPPEAMVPEGEVRALHLAIDQTLGARRAQTLSWLAGWHTGGYLLAHRIPQPAQVVLRRLPAAVASRILMAAIRRNAWTFVGSGGIETEGGRRIRISGCVLCQDSRVTSGGVYYAAVFERLFQELVDASACVREVACIRSGAPRCVFEIGR